MVRNTHQDEQQQQHYDCYVPTRHDDVGVTPSQFHSYADAVASLFLAISSDGVRWQILLSYVELVIYNVLGGTGEIKPFLRRCILQA